MPKNDPQPLTVTKANTPEQFIIDFMNVLYTRPAPTGISELVAKFCDVTIPEVLEEVTRAQTEIRGEHAIAKESGWEFRNSTVSTVIRSLEVKGSTATALVKVQAKWFWGYPGKADEPTTEVYNVHELRLVKVGNGWLITLNQNLASKNKTQLEKTSTAMSATQKSSGDVGPSRKR